MALLGFGHKAAAQADDDTYEWTRPSRDRGLGYSPERADAAMRELAAQPEPDAPAPTPATTIATPPTPLLKLPDIERRVAWLHHPPTQPGVYWHAPIMGDIESLGLRVVLQVGNQMCVAERSQTSDSVRYTNVRIVGGQWSGPVPLPDGVGLEELTLPVNRTEAADAIR